MRTHLLLPVPRSAPRMFPLNRVPQRNTVPGASHLLPYPVHPLGVDRKLQTLVVVLDH